MAVLAVRVLLELTLLREPTRWWVLPALLRKPTRLWIATWLLSIWLLTAVRARLLTVRSGLARLTGLRWVCHRLCAFLS